MKKMAVIGAGAIGSLLGGYISMAGEDITLIGPFWREHIEAMRRRGLKIDGSRGEHQVKVKALHADELSQLEAKLDVLFIAVKSNDTERMVTLMKPYLKEGAWVISCQNGMNEDIIKQIVGASCTIGCVVVVGGAVWEPGRVTQTGKPNRQNFTIGELDGKVTPRLEELQRIMSLCVPTRITTNIWGRLWSKMVSNCLTNSMEGIIGHQPSELFQNQQVRQFCRFIAAEVIKVAEALGHKVEPVWGQSAELWKRSALSPMPEVDQAMITVGRAFDTGMTSMHQDLIKGRPTEIDFLNGYVVKRGREVGVLTPANEAALRLVKEIESGKLKPGLDNIDALFSSLPQPS